MPATSLARNNFEIQNSEEPVSLLAYFKVKPGSRQGKIYIEATIEPGWHLYSVTQPPGGPTRSRMKLVDEDTFTLIGPWEPDEQPHVKFDTEIYKIDIESHEFGVIWSAPFEFKEGFDFESGEIEINYTGQTCVDSGRCLSLIHISEPTRPY